jgi:hypothetical protein
MSSSSSNLLKSRNALVIAGVLVVGGVGGWMYLGETPPVKVPVANAKPAPAKKSATRPSAAAPRTGAMVAQRDREDITPARSAPVAQAARAEVAQAPEPAPRAVQMPAIPKRITPDAQSTSDAEGLFIIASLTDGQPPQQPEVKTAPGDIASNTLAERVVNSTNSSVTDGLGPVYVDDSNGYYVRFPAGWSIRRFDGEPWVVEVGDGRNAMMSIGFSAFPSEYTADNIPLEWVAKRIKKRPDTTLNAQGYATIMGRKAIWSKSTGPVTANGKAVKCIRTTYVLPLGDGRIAEIRIAATPDTFEKLAPMMKNAVSTFRLSAHKRAGGTDQSVAKIE